MNGLERTGTAVECAAAITCDVQLQHGQAVRHVCRQSDSEYSLHSSSFIQARLLVQCPEQAGHRLALKH